MAPTSNSSNLKADGARRRGKQPAPEEKETPKKGKDLSAKNRRGSPKDAPKPPIRKSTRVPNLDQPMPDLSGFKMRKGAKQLLKGMSLAEVSSLFMPPSASDLAFQRLV